MIKIRLLAVLMAISVFSSFIVFAQENPTYTKFAEAEMVITSLLNQPAFDVEQKSAITRAQFVATVAKLFKVDNIMVNGAVFGDVPSTSTYANGVYAALSLGWITSNDKFYPNKEILFSEAVKILISAMDYKVIAENSGAYPTGYLKVAKDIKLLKNIPVKSDGNIDTNTAYLLLYNAMNAYAMEVSYSTDTKYKVSSETYFSKLYSVYHKKGIITSTKFNSLNENHVIESNDYIEIDGEKFDYDNPKADMLGMKCELYYKIVGSENEIVAVVPNGNIEKTFEIKKINGFSNNELVFQNDETDNKESYSLDPSYSLIYNGRKVNEITNQYYAKAEGNIRLLDNDADGKFEVVFIDTYRYVKVNTVDKYEKYITDVKDASNNIDLSIKNCDFSIHNQDGEELKLYNIEVGKILAVKSSLDNLIVDITVFDDEVTGDITGIELSNNNIYIDNEKFDISDYFKSYYLNELKLGDKVTISIGRVKSLVALKDSSSQFHYGYLVDGAIKSSVSQTLQLKVFTDKGEMIIYDVKDNVLKDGNDNYISSNDLYNILAPNNTFIPQLIRFSLRNDNVIAKVDLAISNSAVEFGKTLPSDNSLTKFTYANVSMKYKSAPKALEGFVNVGSSVIFKIPSDLTQDEKFEIISSSRLSNDGVYGFEIYDVNSNGLAGALVWVYNDASNVDYTTQSFIIEKISVAMNDKGEKGKKIYGWSNNKFNSYFIKDDIKINKASGTGLCPGDVIRMTILRSEVQAVVVDIDGSSGDLVSNTISGVTFDDGNQDITYQQGNVYSCKDGNIYISKTKDSSGKYDYSFVNLRYFKLNSAIIKYNKTTQKLRPIDENEIKTYLSNGNDANNVFIRQRSFVTSLVIVVE